MANIDPWQKAYEYQKALKRITDPKLRAVFTEFRDLWIALANRSPQQYLQRVGFREAGCRSDEAFR